MSKIEKTGFGKSFLDGLFYKNPFHLYKLYYDFMYKFYTFS